MIATADMNKEVTIQVRLTAEEHKRWLAAAEKDDRSLSNWIRRQCNAATSTAEPSAIGDSEASASGQSTKRTLAACMLCLELVPPAGQPTHRCSVAPNPENVKLMKTAIGRAQLAASGRYFEPVLKPTKKGAR